MMRAALFSIALGLAAVGCDDPAKKATKAVTGEAKPTAASTSTAQKAEVFVFDGTGSKVEWVGSKVTGKHEGGFKSFKGEVALVDGDPERSRVEVEIETASLFTDSDKLAGHLRSADFFDVEKFPKAKFSSSSVKKGGDKGATHTIVGNLSLHGVTKSIAFPATVRATGGGVEVDAEFAINRKDFGIVYAGKPDDLIRDDVVIKLTIRAAKKPA